MDFDYRAMVVQHKGRPAVIAFDFIPPRPSKAQLAGYCGGDCESCPFGGKCPDESAAIPADRLETSCPAYSRYFLDLYKRTMTGKLREYQKTCGGPLLMPSAV